MDRKALIEEAIIMARNAYGSAYGASHTDGMIAAARVLMEAAEALNPNPWWANRSSNSAGLDVDEAKALGANAQQLAAATMSAVDFASGCGSAASTSASYSTGMQLCPCGDLCPCHIPKDVLGDGGV